MKIITISREFGSGGRELGKRLSDVLGFDYYDREIVTEIAKNCGLNETYVEQELGHFAWHTIPLTFKHSFSAYYAVQSAHTGLLLEQRKVIEGIAKAGRDCVIVGRNADVILREYSPLNIFVCADAASKLQRCRERADKDEHLTDKQMARKIRSIDKNRAKLREMITDAKWGDRGNYHLIVNTTGWNIKQLTFAVAEYAVRWFERG